MSKDIKFRVEMGRRIKKEKRLKHTSGEYQAVLVIRNRALPDFLFFRFMISHSLLLNSMITLPPFSWLLITADEISLLETKPVNGPFFASAFQPMSERRTYFRGSAGRSC